MGFKLDKLKTTMKRIENKYIRNRCFHVKHWKRIRSKEHPYKTMCPFLSPWYSWTYESQIKYHFEDITTRSRAIENGTHRHWNHAPKHFRKILNNRRKARERNALAKLRQGDYEVEFPKFKRDADWLWF